MLPIPRNGSDKAVIPHLPQYVPSGHPCAEPAHSADGMLASWRLVFRHKGTLAGVAAAGALIAVGVGLTTSPVYEARVALELQSLNEDFLKTREVDPTSVNYSADTYVQTQIKLLQSEALKDRVRKKLARTAAQTEAAVPAAFPSIRRFLPLPLTRPAPDRREAIERAAHSVAVRGSGLTRVVEIFCESTSPRVAAEFVNTLATEYLQQTLEVRSELWQQTNGWMGAQLEQLRLKLEKAETQLQAQATQSGLTIAGERDNLAESKLKQLQDELVRAQADRVARQSKYELLRSNANQSLPEVLEDPSLREQRQKLAELSRELAGLSGQLTEDHPKVVRLQARIREVRAAVERERNDILRRIENEYTAAVRREDLIESAYAAQASRVAWEARSAIHYQIAKREADTTRAAYDGLLQRVKEANIASGMSTSSVRIVDPAKVPKQPISPSLVLSSATGVFAGVLAGLVFITTRARQRTGYLSAGEVASCLNVRHLGVVPTVSAERTRSKWRRVAALQRPSSEGERELLPVSEGQKPSLFSDSFHASVASLLFANPDHASVFIVTSSGPREGKTVAAANLAVAATNTGKRVLVIDADMRNPQLHRLFETANNEGLRDVLDQPHPEYAERNIQRTSIAGLSILTSGRRAPGVVPALCSPRMASLIAFLRTRFDLIFIDTPPLLLIPDARLLGRHADGAILIVRARSTSRIRAATALGRLEEDGVPVLGAILNDWDPTRGDEESESLEFYDRYYKGS